MKSRAARGLSIGELAKRAGVRPSAIRYYEAEGIMPAPSRVSGRRIYANADAERLMKIVAARHLGFSIGDLRALKNATAADLKSAAQMRASQLRQTISALADNAARLDGLAYCRCDDGEPCVLT
ncbi:MAG: MerR family transcriptional regulator [Marinicaulis sp.]|nr:MerR family transcriptional regulator [Marinicaulis sp.]